MAAAIGNGSGSDSESDGEGFMMPGLFTQGLDIEDSFDYTFGDEGDSDAVQITLRGVMPNGEVLNQVRRPPSDQ